MPSIELHEINVSDIATLLKARSVKEAPPFFWGPPGIGKTSVVAQAARDMNIGYIKFDAAMRDPSDVRGVLFVVDGKAKYLPPDDLPQVLRDGEKGIFFADEILFAVPAVQNNLHSLIHERRIGNATIPDNWQICAASNREEDRAQIYELSGPLANRFCHYHCKTDFDTWSHWAVDKNIDPLIISYLKIHPQYLAQAPDSLISYATPRSWEFANFYVNSALPENLARASIAGCVGEGIESELFAHRVVGVEAARIIEDIVKGTFPDFRSLKVNMLWVINIYLSVNLKTKYKTFAKPVCEYILKVGEHHSEMAIHTAKLAIAAAKDKITREPLWQQVGKKYADLII